MIIAPMAMPRKADASPIRSLHSLINSLLAVLPAALLLSTLVPLSAMAAPARSQIKAKSADLAQIKSKIGAVTQALAADRGRQDHLQSEVEQAERNLRKGRAQLQDVTSRLKVQDAKLARAKAAHDAAEKQLQAQQKALAGQLRAAYMLGSGNRLQLLLSSQDPGLVGRLLGYYGYLGRARAARIDQVNAQIQQVAALEQEIGDERNHLHALQGRRKQALDDLQQDRKARATAVEHLKARIADRSDQLQRLRASEKQVVKLLDSLKTALSSEPYDLGNHTPFGRLKGRLPWPLRGALLARYGGSKADGQLRWKGTWIAATQGAPVRASARGRVVYVGWISSYGLIVLLQHDENYFTLYGHDATVDVTVGSTVDAGQVIAEAGDTGGYDHSGVYFEIRHGSQALDPGKWLAH